jgi:hypothetical protein
LVPKTLRIEVRLNFQIDQKNNDLLILIRNFLGGNIGYRKSKDTYYYVRVGVGGLVPHQPTNPPPPTTSFGSAKNVINYFYKYHLLSSKHVNYLKWRKAYILIQKKEHLTTAGLIKITQIKKTMNRSACLSPCMLVGGTAPPRAAGGW